MRASASVPGGRSRLASERHLRGQHADRGRGAPALVMKVDAESADPRHLARRVRQARVPVGALRVRRQLGQDHLFDVHAVERREIGARDPAVDAKRRRLARDEQQVAGAAIGDHAQPRLEP